MSTKRSAPHGLTGAGAELWFSVLDVFELDPYEEALLLQAARAAVACDQLAKQVEDDGLMTSTSQGDRVHPALVELRQQQLTYARLVAALRLPQGEEGDQQATARPQRRGGARGVQAIRAVR